MSWRVWIEKRVNATKRLNSQVGGNSLASLSTAIKIFNLKSFILNRFWSFLFLFCFFVLLKFVLWRMIPVHHWSNYTLFICEGNVPNKIQVIAWLMAKNGLPFSNFFKKIFHFSSPTEMKFVGETESNC